MSGFNHHSSPDGKPFEPARLPFGKARSAAARFFHTIPAHLQGDAIMGVNRIIAGSLMLLFTLLLPHDASLRQWAGPVLAWLVCGLALMAFLGLLPRFCVLRRSLAILLDVTGTTIMMAAGGQVTAFLYVVYLWIIIGNGFRFGGGYIFAASLASAAGFGVLIAADTFWRDHLSLSLGLMSGLIVLPAYSFALIRQLAHARRQAERADRAKSLFLAGVSHELRTPLNAIIGTAELLQATHLDGAQTEMVATINSAADGQLSLIQDVLEYSRIEVGGARVEVRPFDLVDLLGAVKGLVAVEAQRKGLLINTYIASRTPQHLVGDERHLREVLLNLCGNAIKFTSAGSVTLAADGIDTGDGVVRLRLEVMDTGIGIANDAQEDIFGLFTQADPTILDRYGGTGLGLALCKRQIQLMGGAIGVESTPNKGSTFWVLVELARDAAPRDAPSTSSFVFVSADLDWARFMRQRLAARDDTGSQSPTVAFVQEGSGAAIPPVAGAAIQVVRGDATGLPTQVIRERFATTVSQHSTAAELHNAVRIAAAQCVTIASSGASPATGLLSSRRTALRVLVADDNALNRSIVSRMLESAGFSTVFATDGEQALAILTDGDVDVALLDVNMPAMGGIQTAELYGLSILGGTRVPLIALTADATPQTRARCLKAGMQSCLVKPVRTAALIEALEKTVPGWTGDNVVSFKPKAEPSPALDHQVLEDLNVLGGTPFLKHVLETFKLDGSSVLAQIEASLEMNDVIRFRSEAHSLSSIGANVGAKALRDLCTPWKTLPEAALLRDGAMLIAKLHREWERTCRELDRYAAGQAGDSSAEPAQG